MIMGNRRITQTQTGFRTASLGVLDRGVLASAVVALSLLLGAMLDSRPPAAQAACGERAFILKNLERTHSEMPQAMGLSTEGTVIEVLVSSAGSWTILITYPNRLTCLVATGAYWESLPTLATGPSA